MREWIVAVLLLVTLLGMEQRAEACSCLPPDEGRSYNNADHVVHARVLGVVRQSQTSRLYLARLVEDDFKGCLERGHWVLVRSAANGAACGIELARGQEYLLHGSEAGSSFGLPILAVGLCDSNARWAEVTAEQHAFLDSRFVCCGEECACTDGSQPVSCFVDPCQVSRCDVEGATCAANYCGGCNAEWYDESGARVCQEPPPCERAGCSGQLCLEAGSDVVTTCEWRDEYACYQAAECALQADGTCSWTPTPELEACLANPPVP